MNVYASITDLIGKTPLLALHNYGKEFCPNANVLAKLEFFNPAGSAKDRVAYEMITRAEADGRLKPGSTIIEPTSGNTGIGLAAIAAAKGYRVIITMPDTMSEERKRLLQAYGAELVLTDGSRGMQGAIDEAKRLCHEIQDSFLPDQFGNPANPAAHEKTTGPEIWNDTDGLVDIFVAGVGTGGTISGVGKYLKACNPGVQIVAVEPAKSPVLSGGVAGTHGLQGIGAGFIPDTLDTAIYDRVIPVLEDDALLAARRLTKKEGILAGISSGAALHAATLLANEPQNHGKTIVVLLPDSGERYLSVPGFAQQ